MNRIKTPLLRILTLFFGHLGLQLYDFSLSDLRSILVVVLNVTFLLVNQYWLYFEDPFNARLLVNTVLSEKPFIRRLYLGCLMVALPTTQLLKTSHYFFTGASIVQLLDNDCFYLVYRDFAWKRWFFGFIAAHTIYYVVLNIFSFAAILQQPSLIELVKLISLFSISNQTYFDICTLHYYQYGTRKTFQQIEHNLLVNQSPNCEMQSIEQIRLLAEVNNRLHSLTSLPVLMFLLLMLINVIAVICIALTVQIVQFIPILMFALYATFCCSYIVYLLSMNQQIGEGFHRICALLNQPRANSQRSLNSVRIKLHEVLVYERYFTLRLFYLTQIDLSVLFATALLILSYVIFLYQTN